MENEKTNAGENFEEVPVFQEVEKKEEVVRTDSYFDGGVIELIGWRLLAFLISGITLGIGIPWAKCMLYSYQFKHTVYNGKRLKFEGTGGDLFVNMFKWVLLTLITFGIYGFFVPVRKTQWVISNIHFEDEPAAKGESYFDGKTIQLIGVNILCNILNVISLGLLFPFTICYKLGWINRHTVINRKKIVFDGKALSLFGHWLLWGFFTIITLGIFGLWLPIQKLKWQAKNTHIKVVGEQEKKDSTLLIAIPIIILAIVLVLTLVIPTVVIMSQSTSDNKTIEEFFENIPILSKKSNNSSELSRNALREKELKRVSRGEFPSIEDIASTSYSVGVSVNGGATTEDKIIFYNSGEGIIGYDDIFLSYDESLGYASYVSNDYSKTIEAYFTYSIDDTIKVEMRIYNQNTGENISILGYGEIVY